MTSSTTLVETTTSKIYTTSGYRSTRPLTIEFSSSTYCPECGFYPCIQGECICQGEITGPFCNIPYIPELSLEEDIETKSILSSEGWIQSYQHENQQEIVYYKKSSTRHPPCQVIPCTEQDTACQQLHPLAQMASLRNTWEWQTISENNSEFQFSWLAAHTRTGGNVGDRNDWYWYKFNEVVFPGDTVWYGTWASYTSESDGKAPWNDHNSFAINVQNGKMGNDHSGNNFIICEVRWNIAEPFTTESTTTDESSEVTAKSVTTNPLYTPPYSNFIPVSWGDDLANGQWGAVQKLSGWSNLDELNLQAQNWCLSETDFTCIGYGYDEDGNTELIKSLQGITSDPSGSWFLVFREDVLEYYDVHEDLIGVEFDIKWHGGSDSVVLVTTVPQPPPTTNIVILDEITNPVIASTTELDENYFKFQPVTWGDDGMNGEWHPVQHFEVSDYTTHNEFLEAASNYCLTETSINCIGFGYDSDGNVELIHQLSGITSESSGSWFLVFRKSILDELQISTSEISQYVDISMEQCSDCLLQQNLFNQKYKNFVDISWFVLEMEFTHSDNMIQVEYEPGNDIDFYHQADNYCLNFKLFKCIGYSYDTISKEILLFKTISGITSEPWCAAGSSCNPNHVGRIRTGVLEDGNVNEVDVGQVIQNNVLKMGEYIYHEDNFRGLGRTGGPARHVASTLLTRRRANKSKKVQVKRPKLKRRRKHL